MYHSITIGERNTWDDWHLVPTSRPLVNPPSVKTSYVDLPGGDGVLDLSTALTGRPLYGNRTGEWTFLVMNDYQDWNVLYTRIMAYLHGQTFKIILEDEPTFYYEGRLALKEWTSGAVMSSIVIQYNLDTYKYPVNGASSGVNVTAQAGTVMLNGSTYGITDEIPWIHASISGMTVTFEGRSHTLSKGWNRFGDILLKSGNNSLRITGSGTVIIDVPEGRL